MLSKRRRLFMNELDVARKCVAESRSSAFIWMKLKATKTKHNYRKNNAYNKPRS